MGKHHTDHDTIESTVAILSTNLLSMHTLGRLFSRATNFAKKKVRGNSFHESTFLFSLQSMSQ